MRGRTFSLKRITIRCPAVRGRMTMAFTVAACLECARLAKENQLGPTMIDPLQPEKDAPARQPASFIQGLPSRRTSAIEEAHIFEMVGFRSHAAGAARRCRQGCRAWRRRMSTIFSHLLRESALQFRLPRQFLRWPGRYLPTTPVMALKIYLGLEEYFGHLLRSGHCFPFYGESGDSLADVNPTTSEFHNAHYHETSDLPDTLDYRVSRPGDPARPLRTLLPGDERRL